MVEETAASLTRGLFLAPFDQLADPLVLVDLAVRAEAHGWDGLFLWDHIVYRPPVRAVADPWVALSAIASATERLRLGPMVTPLSRRRVQKVARETVTLDHLSGGRVTLGVGLGSSNTDELVPFGEVVDPRERSRLLDQGSAGWQRCGTGSSSLARCSDRGSRCGLQAAGRTAARSRAPRRGAGFSRSSYRDRTRSRKLAGEIAQRRGQDDGPFDLVVEIEPGEDSGPWRDAGATWVLTGFGPQPEQSRVGEVIEAGAR